MKKLFFTSIFTVLLGAPLAKATSKCDLLFDIANSNQSSSQGIPTLNASNLEAFKKGEEQLAELLQEYNHTTEPIRRKLLHKNIENIHQEILRLNPNFSIQSIAKQALQRPNSSSQLEEQKIEEATNLLGRKLNLQLKSEESLPPTNNDLKMIESEILSRLQVPAGQKHRFYMMKRPTFNLIQFSQPKFIFMALGTKNRFFVKFLSDGRTIELINYQNKTNPVGTLIKVTEDKKYLYYMQHEVVKIFLIDQTTESVDFAKPIKTFAVSDRFISYIVQSIELSPDQKYLGFFTASEFFIHDIDNNRLFESDRFQSHGKISFSPNSQMVAISEGKTAYVFEIGQGLRNPIHSEVLKIEYGTQANLIWTNDSQNLAVAMMGPRQLVAGFVLNVPSRLTYPLDSPPVSANLRWSELDLKWDQSQRVLGITASSSEKSIFSTFDLRYMVQQSIETPDFKGMKIKEFDGLEVTLSGTSNKESGTADSTRTYRLN